MTDADLRAELERAQRALAEQAMELAELRARAGPDASATALLAMSAAGGSEGDASMHDELLDLIVRTATVVLDAEAASLFLIDPDSEELIFQVAVGGAGEMLQGQRIPLGTGIVGFVAATSNPLVVNDVAEDSRFAASFAQSIGYMPRNILAVPLLHAGDVVGVLEVLNKRRGEDNFTNRDIDVLGMFANQAAAAVGRSVMGRDMIAALRSTLEKETGEAPDAAARPSLAPYALRLSSLLQDIGRRGEAERRLCLDIVTAVQQYLEGLGRLPE